MPDLCTECGTTRCPCPRCHGRRWVQVQPSYALRHAPDPTVEQLAELAPAQQDALLLHIDARRAALRDTYYPCRDCNQQLFYRWAGGHLDPDHDTGNCDDCIETMGKRAARRNSRMTTTTPERRDLD